MNPHPILLLTLSPLTIAAIDYLVDPFAGKPGAFALVATLAAVTIVSALPEHRRHQPAWVDFAYFATGLTWIAAMVRAIVWAVLP